MNLSRAGLGRSILEPVASPVDTFVRPQENSGLQQLASSLKEVAPEVAKYAEIKGQQQDAAQKEAGAQKARELFESGANYRDAIKKGLISPAESPWFQLGAKEQYGRVTAGQFSSDLKMAVAKEPSLQESTDVGAYDKFAADFKKQWMATNVGDDNRGLNFEHGFGSMADQFSKDSRQEFVEKAGQRLVTQVGDRHYGEVFTTLDHELSIGTSHDAIAQGISLINARAVAMGVDANVANHAVVKAVGDMAMKSGDASLFDILDKVSAGNSSVAARPWAQEEIQKVTRQVYEDKQRHAVADREAATAERQDHSRTEVGQMTSQLIMSDNPSRVDLRDRIAALALTDHDAADNLTRFQQTMSGAKFASNTAAVNHTLANIYGKPVGDPDYVDVQSLVKLSNAHEINQQDFESLAGQIRDRDETYAKASHEHNPYTDPQYTHAASLLSTLVAGDMDVWKPEVARRIDGANSEFGKEWLDYMAGPGKGATGVDKAKFIEETKLRIADKWRSAQTTQEAGTGPRPVGAKQSTVPSVDLRTPGAKKQMRDMANTIDSQARAGKGFSPGVINFMRRNKIINPAEYVKKYGGNE